MAIGIGILSTLSLLPLVLFLLAIVYMFSRGSDSVSSDRRIILRNLTRVDGTNLSAEGNRCKLNVECDEIGTSVTYALGNVESTVIIAKGSLASISFTKSSQPLWLVLSILFAILGLLAFVGGGAEGAAGGVGTIFISVIFYLVYYMSKMSVLELDSSGAQTYSFQFSGAAANRSSDIALFCRAAILNDLGLQEVEIGDFP
jgi:hypothetical protein